MAKKKKTPTIFGFKEPEWLNVIHLPNWMVFVLAAIFLLRIPSFFEPYHNAQEMMILTTLMNGIIPSLFWLKVLLAGWMVATTVAFYKLSKALFPKNIAVTQAAVATFVILTTLPLLEGQIANSEMFLIGPVIAVFYLIVIKNKKFAFNSAKDFAVVSVALSVVAIMGISISDVELPLSLDFSLYSKLIILIIGIAILYWFRKKLSKQFIFATLWLLFALFAAVLSEQPTPHSLIQVVPAISLLAGMLIAYPSLEQSLTVIPLSLVLIAVVQFNFWYYPTISYYQNFAEFITQKKSRTEYFDNFSPQTNLDYKISEFLVSTTEPDDSIFVWGNGAAIQALSDRKLNSNAEIILIKPNTEVPAELRHLVNSKYILIENIDDVRIYKLMSLDIQSIR